MEKKNVLFLAEELRVGGAETYFYILENTVNRAKFNFYTMAVNYNQFKRLEHPEYYIPYEFSQINRYKKALEVCVKNKISVIHVNSLRLAFVAAAIKKRLNLSVIYTKHNLTALEKVSKTVYSKFLNSNIDIVNVICHADKEYLLSIGVKDNKIRVIYNGIKIEDFPFIHKCGGMENINIGILARVDKVKNHQLFISIAEKVHAAHANTKFYIGGDGPDRNTIETLIQNKNMSDYVFMCGYVKAQDFLKDMNYSVLVSQREVLPMSIIEAMATGVIVVAKNLGGIKELVDNSVGYVIDGDDVDLYVNALTTSFHSNCEEQKIMKAREKVEKIFTLDRMLRQIEQLYLEC